MPFNKSVLNEEYNLGTFKVTEDMIRDFLASTGAEGDHGTEAPALIATLFANFEGPEDLNLEFEGFDYMAGQYIEPEASVKAGDVLTCVARVKSVYKKTGVRPGREDPVHGPGDGAQRGCRPVDYSGHNEHGLPFAADHGLGAQHNDEEAGHHFPGPGEARGAYPVRGRGNGQGSA